MNSYFEYVPGRATQSYRAEVDEAAALAERQKGRVDPIHHERIDCLLDTFARKLADNINRRNEIAARVPSIARLSTNREPIVATAVVTQQNTKPVHTRATIRKMGLGAIPCRM